MICNKVNAGITDRARQKILKRLPTISLHAVTAVMIIPEGKRAK